MVAIPTTPQWTCGTLPAHPSNKTMRLPRIRIVLRNPQLPVGFRADVVAEERYTIESSPAQVHRSQASSGGYMNRDCKQGLQLRLHFEHALKEWGWFDAYEKA